MNNVGSRFGDPRISSLVFFPWRVIGGKKGFFEGKIHAEIYNYLVGGHHLCTSTSTYHAKSTPPGRTEYLLNLGSSFSWIELPRRGVKHTAENDICVPCNNESQKYF